MKKRDYLIALVAVVMFTGIAVAGVMLLAKTDTPPQCPFGFCMGHAIDEEPEGRGDNGLLYVTKEHDLFDGGITVFWTNSTLSSKPSGVCGIKGTYKVPNPDDYGVAHKMAFNKMSDFVRSTYGEPSNTFDKNYKYVGHGKPTPSYWLKELTNGSRHLVSYWIEEPSVLPPGLSIKVAAKSSAIEVNYQFINWKDCVREGKSAQASAQASGRPDF